MKLSWVLFFNKLKIWNETCLEKRNLILLRWHEHQLNNTCPVQIQDGLQHFCKHTQTPSAPPLAHLSRPGKSSRSCGRHSVGNTREKHICSELAPGPQKAGSCFPLSPTTRPGMCCFLMFNQSCSASAGYETPSSSIRSADTKQMWLTSGLWIYLWKGILICWRLDFKNVTGV